MKRAKIVCTIGPSSSGAKVLTSMIRVGMDVARLNFSHGTHEDHADYMRTVRRCSRTLGKTVAILQDLQGIKIRIGDVSGGRIELKTGTEILVRSGNGVSDDACLYVRYPALEKDVKKGDRILIDDGLIQLKVIRRARDGIRVRVVEGGEVTGRKGVNLPDTRINVTSFTPKDRKDLAFGIEQDVDYIAVSFVRTGNDIQKIKRFMKRNNVDIPVIAKIEKPEALDNIDDILTASDGIMIARGDLGVEMNAEEVPIIQKELISKANHAGKIVITATQMLESMTVHRRPTRAEVTDVANAVIDGSDAVMLSGETSSGKYPEESVAMMSRIISYAEKNLKEWEVIQTRNVVNFDYPYVVAEAAVKAADDIHAKAIVAFTDSGYTARLVSKFRPSVPLIVFTASEKVQKQVSLYWGATCFLMGQLQHTDEMIDAVEGFVLKRGFARKGDTIVVIASSPLSVLGKTNFMKLHKIG